MTSSPLPALLDRRLMKRFDVPLAAAALGLLAMGLLALHSVTEGGTPVYFRKQLVWGVLGIAGMLLAAAFGHERLDRYAGWIYGLNVVLLAAVLVMGHETKGSMRWFAIGQFRLQPSELAKLFLIITLAGLFQRHRERIDRPRVVVVSLVHMLVPVLLILRQPDLGTALVLGAIWLGMAFIAGVPIRYLAVVLVCAVAAFGVMAKAGVIREYQIRRLLICLNPDADPKGAGYQVQQARIAIGSGRVFGKGFGHGTQSQGEFVPERQTDFIYTMLAEEGGFVAATTVLALFSLLILRGWSIVGSSEGRDRLLGTGVLSMLTFHGIVNMAMNVGLGPVTGVPLPLVSYGGSSLIVALVGIGFVLGIGMRRDPLVF
jgi:rod shape determining protein RodA